MDSNRFKKREQILAAQKLTRKLTRRLVFYPFLLFVAIVSQFFGMSLISMFALAILFAEIVILIVEKHEAVQSQVRNATESVNLPRTAKNVYPERNREWPEGSWSKKELGIEDVVFNKELLDESGLVEIPSINMRKEFRYRTDESGRRLTSSRPTEDEQRPIIAIFGCSCTFGQILSDEETFAWKLQEQLSDFRVLNYGVCGFSPFEMLLQMRAVVPIIKPKYLIYAYHPVQDGRNTRKLPEFEWFRGPTCISKLSKNGKRKLKTYKPAFFSLLFGVLPPSLRAICFAISKLEFWPHNKKENIEHTMRHIFLEMRKLCEENSVPLVVKDLDRVNLHSEFLASQGFTWIQSDIPTTEVLENGGNEWSFYPLDYHPNLEAQKHYADSLFSAITMLDEGKKLVPKSLNRASNAKVGNEEAVKFIYPLF